jgi:4-deoxy-L-threo-5-hexosulose-uronate ketol-isomerase
MFEKENNHYTYHPARSAEEVKQMDTAKLRNAFLVENIFVPDTVTAAYSMQDRYVVLGTMPVKQALELPAFHDLTKADFFLERREMGILNVGHKGKVTVDGEAFLLNNKDCLYIGKGKQKIIFESEDEKHPALFYCNSALAAAPYPSVHISKADIEPLTLGDVATSNYRKIYQYIIPGRVQSCQLVLGFTELLNGSVWNSIPPHTHKRRNEVYFYFDLPEEQMLLHLMGEPEETRHIIVRNHQAVISPEWSIHAGAGTASYTFIWGMAGENQDYTDMDKLELKELR